MPNKPEPCPGPDDKGCPHKNERRSMGGRCRPCALQRNRTQQKTRDRIRRAFGSNKADDKQPASVKHTRIQEDIQKARSVSSESFGLKGAVKVHDAMLRAE